MIGYVKHFDNKKTMFFKFYNQSKQKVLSTRTFGRMYINNQRVKWNKKK